MYFRMHACARNEAAQMCGCLFGYFAGMLVFVNISSIKYLRLMINFTFLPSGREPFQLVTFMKVYNLCIVLLSLWMFFEVRSLFRICTIFICLILIKGNCMMMNISQLMIRRWRHRWWHWCNRWWRLWFSCFAVCYLSLYAWIWDLVRWSRLFGQHLGTEGSNIIDLDRRWRMYSKKVFMN